MSAPAMHAAPHVALNATSDLAQHVAPHALKFDLPVPDLSPWRAGNTSVEGVWHFDSGQAGRRVLITALIHGNELCGAWALKVLLESGLRPRRGSLTLAFCNLAAFERFDIHNVDASRFVQEDMNRVWSPDKLADPRSLERRRAQALLPFVQQADWLLDLHSMHESGEPLLLTGLQPRNLELARHIGSPTHIVVDAGHAEGCRLRDSGTFGDLRDSRTRSLLIECGYHGEVASREVAVDSCARFLQAAQAVDATDLPAHWLLPKPKEQKPVRVTDAVVAHSTNLQFAQNWQGLQVVEHAGTVLATDGQRTFTTPYDRCTLIMPSLRQLRPGVTVMRLAQALDAPVVV
jgi:succinylglutamate desuccinylase